MNDSLLRFVPTATVETQFHRMAGGGSRLSAFKFIYKYPRLETADQDIPELEFEVQPDKQPPTNVHVVIGRNGVGKSLFLNNIARILVQPQTRGRGSVDFMSARRQGTARARSTYSQFANVVSIAFSAFDDFLPISVDATSTSPGTRYTYIGLKENGTSTKQRDGASLKGPRALGEEFSLSVTNCVAAGKLKLWREALEMLESDPIFADAQVADLAVGVPEDNASIASNAQKLYGSFSSGHKIVLLTITRLVETIQERSLVVIDEPECHLHPPLLSAFIRALSNLMIDRNGVAIIATHSPVVLQEVPEHCVWVLRRSGSLVSAERPAIETFGENVGVLTHEVFGLEVTQSGFHRLLMESVNSTNNLSATMQLFENRVGSEGRALLQAEIIARHEEQ